MKYYLRLFRGNLVGGVRESETELSSSEFIECENYEAFNPYQNRIKSRSIVNGKVVFVYEDLTEIKKAQILAAEKTKQKSVIFYSFLQAPKQGFQCSFGFRMDCERDDIDNIRSLLTILQAQSLPGSMIRGFDNSFHELTTAQIGQLLLEMIGHGLFLYQIKWTLEGQIDVASTIEGVRSIVWPAE